MESSFEKSKNVYKSKVPELEQTLELIEIMIKKRADEEEMLTNYSLCDTIFARAEVCNCNLYFAVGDMLLESRSTLLEASAVCGLEQIPWLSILSKKPLS